MESRDRSLRYRIDGKRGGRGVIRRPKGNLLGGWRGRRRGPIWREDEFLMVDHEVSVQDLSQKNFRGLSIPGAGRH